MRPLSRRDFLHDSGRIAAALAAAGLLGCDGEKQPKPAGGATGSAGDRLRVALIGANKPNGRGLEHVGFIAGKNNCELVTICDCDEAVVDVAMNRAEKQ